MTYFTFIAEDSTEDREEEEFFLFQRRTEVSKLWHDFFLLDIEDEGF